MIQDLGAEGNVLPFSITTEGEGSLPHAPIRAIHWREGVMEVDTPASWTVRQNHSLTLGSLGCERPQLSKLTDISEETAKTARQGMLRQLGTHGLGLGVTRAFQKKWLNVAHPGYWECGNRALTPREIEALERAAAGQSVKQTALFLGVGDAYVKYFRERMMEKVGVTSVVAGITAAYLAQRLSPEDIHVFQSVQLGREILPFQIRTQDDGPLRRAAYLQIARWGGILGLHPNGLSISENRTLAFGMQGLEPVQIAKLLNSRPSIIAQRTATIFEKLEVNNFEKAVDKGFREEWLTVDKPILFHTELSEESLQERQTQSNPALALLLSHMTDG